MSTQHPTDPINRNHDTISGLRAVADLLEAHPDLPPCSWTLVHLGHSWGENTARPQDAAALANALATAGVKVQLEVSSLDAKVTGRFAGDVELLLEVALSNWAAPAPTVPSCVKCGGSGQAARDGSTEDGPCGTCGGTGWLVEPEIPFTTDELLEAA